MSDIEQNRAILKELPKELQEAITSPDRAKVFTRIWKKHNLHADVVERLSEEVADVLLGKKKPSGFVQRIQKKLDLPFDKANEITKDINEEIFEPIRDQLQEAQSIAGRVRDKSQEEVSAQKTVSGLNQKRQGLEMTRSTERKVDELPDQPMDTNQGEKQRPYDGTDPYREKPEE